MGVIPSIDIILFPQRTSAQYTKQSVNALR